MKRFYSLSICFLFLLTVFASAASAVSLGYLPKNENHYLEEPGLTVGAKAVFTLEPSITTFFLGKIENWNSESGVENGFLINGFGLNDDNELSSGKWFGPAGYSVDYVTVSAGNGFNIFDGTDNLWETPDDKGLSHISFWGNMDDEPGDPNAPVPEPATMVLLGFGLIGMAAMRKKFRN